MMADAHRGAFDVLVVWALDRFGRSMVGNLRDVLELDRCGVQVVSVRETWLDTGSAALLGEELDRAFTRIAENPNIAPWPRRAGVRRLGVLVPAVRFLR
jgi:hypothetical protein